MPHKFNWSSSLTSRLVCDNFTYPIAQLYHVSIIRNRRQISPLISEPNIRAYFRKAGRVYDMDKKAYFSKFSAIQRQVSKDPIPSKQHVNIKIFECENAKSISKKALRAGTGVTSIQNKSFTLSESTDF